MAGEEPRPSSGRTAGPPPLAAHLPGPLSAALAAQPRGLPGEQALLTDSVLLLFCFTAFLTGASRRETQSATSPACRVVCQTSGAGTRAAGRGNPDCRRRQPRRVAQRLKLPEPRGATGGKEKPDG